MSDRKLSFPKNKINIVLFEGISQTAVKGFSDAGYTNVKLLPTAGQGDELQEHLSTAHMVGVRSRTQLTAEVLAAAPKLMAIGCFCIGTNQVDLQYAARAGIPVFNAPHANTRSVAELVLAELVMLFRGTFDKSRDAHLGKWSKTARGSHELRGRTLGIVGYGHIGSQVSVLAEAFGMHVVYYDVAPVLPLGNARRVESLEELLGSVDAVTLHVPQAPDTANLIGAKRIAQIRDGAIVINASRGTVVDLDALAERLKAGELAGAAVDVFPVEPRSNAEEFTTPLQGLDNVILTPHVGGSTEEAQLNIGMDVARRLSEYSDLGSTLGSVNFPPLSLAPLEGARRLLHVHANQSGVLGAINQVQANSNANILAQYLRTNEEIGYVVMDVEQPHDPDLLKQLAAVPGTIRFRTLN